MEVKLLKDKLPKGFVNIHNEAFQGFFLTSLGPKFLKLYYNSLLTNPNGIIICAFDNNDGLIGFAAGTKHSKGFYNKILLENIFSYIWALLYIILSRPKAIFRLFKNLNKNKYTINDDGMYAELLSIAVPTYNKGLGYGKLLLKEFEIELQSLNVEKISLTTDCLNNDNVLAFYKKMGYEMFYEFIAYPHRRMYKLIKKL